MSQKVMIILAAAGLLFAVDGAYLTYLISTNDTIFPPPHEDIVNEAIRKNNPDTCLKLPAILPRGGSMRGTCYRKVAFYFKNPEICKNSMNAGIKTDMEKCYEDIALATHDDKACTSLAEFADATRCFNVYAGKFKVVTNCSDIPDHTYRVNCEIQKNGATRELCELLREFPFHQDACLEKLAVQNEDASICSPIVDVWRKDSCLVAVAAKLKKGDVCRLIPDNDSDNYANQYARWKCFKAIASQEQLACFTWDTAEVAGSYPSRRFCLETMAVKNKDVSACDLLKDDQDVAACQQAVRTTTYPVYYPI